MASNSERGSRASRRSLLASFAEKGNGVKIRGQKSAYDTRRGW